MKTKETTVYFCDHCNKLYQRKYFAEKHEKMCAKNPDNNRACHFCIHLEKVDYLMYADMYNGETHYTIDVLHCHKLKKYLHPPQVEIKGNAIDLGDEINEPMPKECDDQVGFNEQQHDFLGFSKF